MRVLICDDTPSVRHEIRRGLESFGFDVVAEAGDGVEGEHLVDKLAPDAVVLDLAMPERDGLELLPILRDRHPGLRIVVFSGLRPGRAIDDVLAAGADAYLEKGSPLVDLVAALRNEGGTATSAETRGPRPDGAEPGLRNVQLVDLYEQERRSIAAELHDVPVQLLAAASLRLESAAERGELDPVVAGRVLEQIGEAATSIRRVMGRLSSDAALLVPTAEPAHERSSRAGTILLVEDEPMIRDLVQRILVANGHELLVAEDASAALALCRSRVAEPVDLLLTDYALPGMGGPALAAEVQSLWPEVAVLCMSGYGHETEGLLPPGARFLQKPFAAQELTDAVHDVLRGRPTG
jgi:DNA-binding response OmpR family regulator